MTRNTQEKADNLTYKVFIRLGEWNIPTDPLPDYRFQQGVSFIKVKLPRQKRTRRIKSTRT